jgi:hypothetical protein
VIADNYSTHKHVKVKSVAEDTSTFPHALHPNQQFLLVEVLETELGIPVHDASRWDTYGGEMQGLVPHLGTSGTVVRHANRNIGVAQ